MATENTFFTKFETLFKAAATPIAVVRLGAVVATLMAALLPLKHEVCYDGGESVSLHGPGTGAFVPQTHEDFDRWAITVGLLGMAVPCWMSINRVNALSLAFVGGGSWVMLHAGATSLAATTCPPHDNLGPELEYKTGLYAAYAVPVFVSAAVVLAQTPP